MNQFYINRKVVFTLVTGIVSFLSGTILLCVGIHCLIQFPIPHQGSSVWTGAWSALTGLLICYLTLSKDFRWDFQKRLVLVALVITCIVNVINIIILVVMDLGSPLPVPRMKMISKMGMESSIIIAYRILLTCSVLGFVNGFIGSQFLFCFILLSKDKYKGTEFKEVQTSKIWPDRSEANYNWVYNEPKISPQSSEQNIKRAQPIAADVNENEDLDPFAIELTDFPIPEAPSMSQVPNPIPKSLSSNTIGQKEYGNSNYDHLESTLKSSSDPSLGHHGQYKFVSTLSSPVSMGIPKSNTAGDGEVVTSSEDKPTSDKPTPVVLKSFARNNIPKPPTMEPLKPRTASNIPNVPSNLMADLIVTLKRKRLAIAPSSDSMESSPGK